MQQTPLQKILIVDDAPENIDILSGILSDYKKSIALNGEKAINIANRDNPPDLILLDILMPGMDGFEVCKILKSQDHTKEIPIIFLTGKSDTESIVKGFELGAADYVTKPFNSSELLARVHTQLALKRSKDEITANTQEIKRKSRMITNSINYAQRIQSAVLPDKNEISALFNDFFVLLRPKDIVSGDFYWFRKIEDNILIITADCTGHGVPGAFMSMLGISFLNEIIDKMDIISPAQILGLLRDKIILSLNQHGESRELKDGMDMTVICIDNSNKKMVYAGAQSELYLVRDGKLTQYDGDHMPVSIYYQMSDFSEHTIALEKNDFIYLFSDGFPDQFGGPKYKKVGYPRFRDLILQQSDKSMEQQKVAFSDFFDQWKEDKIQIDDILMMGIKV